MPALKFTCDGTNLSAIINTNKVEALASTFFPPPLATTYPKPFETQGYFTRNNIHNMIKKLKPFKAPEADGIQNIVIQKCTETIIDHLYFIFHAILELDTYPHWWLMILTIVLQKPGKAEYNIPKAYPILDYLKH